MIVRCNNLYESRVNVSTTFDGDNIIMCFSRIHNKYRRSRAVFFSIFFCRTRIGKCHFYRSARIVPVSDLLIRRKKKPIEKTTPVGKYVVVNIRGFERTGRGVRPSAETCPDNLIPDDDFEIRPKIEN